MSYIADLMPKKLYIVVGGSIVWRLVYIDGQPVDAVEEIPVQRMPCRNMGGWKYWGEAIKPLEHERLLAK